ncbi:MAG: hypothetical protein Q9211_000413 [Gyalolechia sp. 1 TL-2023]
MPPKAQPSQFVKRPAPDGFVRRVAGPPKTKDVRRDQLSLEIADETSILMGVFFATHQNLQPDYAVMEKICQGLNKEGFHYSLTASGFEHAFRDWRIYGDKVLERIGGAHVAILAGARPKSDRQVARLKKDQLLGKGFKYEPKTNVPKDMEICDDDEPETIDPRLAPESPFQLTYNSQQVHDAGSELTTTERIQEPAEDIPEEAAEDFVAKPAAKKTRKRKQAKAANKKQAEAYVVPQDHPAVTIPAGSKDHASSQALDCGYTADEINAAHVLLSLANGPVDFSQPADNPPAHATRHTASSIKDQHFGPTTEVKEPQLAIQKQKDVIVEPESHAVAEDEALPKKQLVPRKNVARSLEKTKVFQPPTGTFSEKFAKAFEESKTPMSNYLQKFVRVEDTECDGQIVPVYVPKESVEESRASEIMGWNGTFQTVKKLIKVNRLDADLNLPDEIDIYSNTFQDLGHEVTMPAVKSPIAAFGRAPHLVVEAISTFDPDHKAQSARVIEGEADRCLKSLKPEMARLEALQEQGRLKSLKRRREVVYDIDAKLQQSTETVKHWDMECRREHAAKGEIVQLCKAIAGKFAPGGEFFNGEAQPKPNRDRAFMRQAQNMTMPWEEEDQLKSGESVDDVANVKRQKTVAGNASWREGDNFVNLEDEE